MEAGFFIIGLVVGAIATMVAVCIAFLNEPKKPLDEDTRDLQRMWQDRLFPHVFDDRLIEVQKWEERKEMLNMYRQVLRAKSVSDFDGLDERYEAWLKPMMDRRIRPGVKS